MNDIEIHISDDQKNQIHRIWQNTDLAMMVERNEVIEHRALVLRIVAAYLADEIHETSTLHVLLTDLGNTLDSLASVITTLIRENLDTSELREALSGLHAASSTLKDNSWVPSNW